MDDIKDETNEHGTQPLGASLEPLAPAARTSGEADEILDPTGEPSVGVARKRRRGSRGGRGKTKSDGSGADEFDDGVDAGIYDGVVLGAELAADRPADPIQVPLGSAASEELAAGIGSGAAARGGDPQPKAATRQRQPAKAKASALADPDHDDAANSPSRTATSRQRTPKPASVELPERLVEGRPSVTAAESALVRRPQIGDTRPAPRPAVPSLAGASLGQSSVDAESDSAESDSAVNKKKRNRSKPTKSKGPLAALRNDNRPDARSGGAQLDADVLEKRRGRERNGRPIGRYLMCVQVRDNLTQVAVLEGRNLVEHYVSRPADDVNQIHGNIYVGKVQNVLPGMEAAFVDIATPKNAVLYRGDVQYDQEDIVERGAGAGSAVGKDARIENILRAKQLIVCQVTKNPIGAKGARLTQEVSLPGRFVVLIPNSKTYGISKRLPDDVRKRLRNILDRVKPAEHGLIVRTAAENASEHELHADMTRLLDQWNVIEAKARKMQGPGLLYREPELAVRVIREEFNAEYRGVVIDDKRLFEDVRDYIAAFNPELADRVEFYDPDEEGLPIYERFHLHEQLHKALDRKVWLPSGGSLIIEHTEALSVIDVNTGKNVGTSNSNLEATVFHNNLEAADEIARQLRLRDIGGIIVIDFIDMEIRENRKKVVDRFKEALARDKTRTQVFDISDLGLVEMTRKRIGEGLLTNFAGQCPNCDGRGVLVDLSLLE